MAPAGRTSFALLAALMLNGCVAAAAIPLLASGAVVRTATDGEDASSDREPSSASVNGVVAVDGVTAETSSPRNTADGRFVVLDRSSLPIPGEIGSGQGDAERDLIAERLASGQRSPESVGFGQASGFSPFLGYALQTGQLTAASEQPLSALLADPTSVDGERLACTANEPAVVIDLDPVDGLFNPKGLPQADTTLAVGLGQLRRAGISIFWISGHSADVAGAIRRSLAVSGLDLENQDSLLLMRYRDDRKQTRRRELSETHCVVAIAGDTKADFDELFDYLLDPAYGAPLEILVGDGWFLTPLALSQPPSLED